jgi:hypothetical protein
MGFILNYKNRKYYPYYVNLSNGEDNQGAWPDSWMPIDSIFNGWPSGRSYFFGKYAVIIANKDSLVINSQYQNAGDGAYAVFVNESNLLK